VFLAKVGHLQKSEQLPHGFILQHGATMLEHMENNGKLRNLVRFVSFELFLHLQTSKPG
jgi:hypothetical protein